MFEGESGISLHVRHVNSVKELSSNIWLNFYEDNGDLWLIPYSMTGP